MASLLCLQPKILERISQILGDVTTGSQITNYFTYFGYNENSTHTKWRRINDFFNYSQNKYNCSNQVIDLTQQICTPVSYINNQEVFNKLLRDLNQVLSFASLKIGDDGIIRPSQQASTINEAKSHASDIHKVLYDRNIHSDVLKFCTSEIVQDNYFHAVLEATKSLSDKIRSKTDLTEDAATLVHIAFHKDKPLLAINTLRTPTDRSEQSGLKSLLLGIFSMFRNTTAHEAKIHWEINKADAIDLLTMISFAHRKIDNCVRTPYQVLDQR